MHATSHWDSWDADIAEFNAQVVYQGHGKGKGHVDGPSDGVDDADTRISMNQVGKDVGQAKGKGENHVGKSIGKNADKGKAKGNGKVGKNADKGKAKGNGKAKGWEGPYTDVLDRQYWTIRNYRADGSSRTKRWYCSEDLS